MQCAASFGRTDLLKEEAAGEMLLISPLPQEILPRLFEKGTGRPEDALEDGRSAEPVFIDELAVESDFSDGLRSMRAEQRRMANGIT
jgi:hypothetical protein